MPVALIVDDETKALSAMSELVEKEGFSALGAASIREARERLAQTRPDVVLVDLMLPDGSGLDLVQEMEPAERPEVILITGFASVDSAVAALRHGVLDYLTKPVDIRRLKTVLANVSRTLALKQEIGSLRDELRELGRFGRLIGNSPVMQKVYDLVVKVAPTDATVLLIGESGTGKEEVAATIHELGRRRSQPFLPVNCGAVPANLIESELFGHERGAFTGAAGQRQGAFEAATGGTVFLDEIGELPFDLQPKLLRVLEQREVRRVGGNKTVPVDIRILAATRKDLDREVAAGRFREDLYFRLAVVPVTVPALRERREDIPLLVERFLEALTRGSAPPVPPETMAALAGHDWPGNVRELRNVLERALYMNPDRSTPLLLASLPSAPMSSASSPGFDPSLSYGENRERAESAFEKAYLTWLLERAGGNVSEAARQAKMDRKYLHKLMKKHGLE